MNRALTKADIVEAIYEKTDRNRADVKNTVEILLGLMKQATSIVSSARHSVAMPFDERPLLRRTGDSSLLPTPKYAFLNALCSPSSLLSGPYTVFL